MGLFWSVLNYRFGMQQSDNSMTSNTGGGRVLCGPEEKEC